MEITLPPQHDRQVIQGYAKGGFRVSDREWRGAIIVLPTRTIRWDATAAAELSLSLFDQIRDAEDPRIELLLIGTGQRTELLSGKLRADLRSLGLGVEAMDTGAACRTYNVLIGEERRVAAALLPIG